MEVGKEVNIEDLDEETAVAIFGRPVYDFWKNAPKWEAEMVVTEVDHKNGVVTLRGG